jgi:imidazolonepropionase
MIPQTGSPGTRLLVHHGRQVATLDSAVGGKLGLIEDGSVLMEGDRIRWVGPSRALPEALLQGPAPARLEVIDARGKVVLPGLIDPHTHLVFSGSREGEFARRLRGESYLQIAQEGGGIFSTVRATRRADPEELTEGALRRLDRMLAFGVTTAEIKSGYGLDLPTELRCLETIRRLRQLTPIELVPTFLGAHAVPQEYRGGREDYLRLVTDRMIPEVAGRGLARFCDVFCDEGAFTVEESRRVLEAGLRHGLRPKIHAEELAYLGGSVLAAELGAVSADHLIHVSDEAIGRMAKAGITAVLLPGTALFLRSGRSAPARKLLEAGVPVALATDCNPGSCMTENLPLAGTLASLQMGLTPAEVVRAMTLDAARALGLQETHGSLAPGKQADLIVLDIPNVDYFPYHFGVSHVKIVVKTGSIVLPSRIPDLP